MSVASHDDEIAAVFADVGQDRVGDADIGGVLHLQPGVQAMTGEVLHDAFAARLVTGILRFFVGDNQDVDIFGPSQER